MNSNFTYSEENYLKTIYHLQSEAGVVTTNALAAELKAKPASITEMMKKLDAKKLLHYKPYYGFSLTAEGKKIAVNIVRRHRLWEFFLSKKLKFDWNEVHELAEELEHVSSKRLINKLDEYLGFPQFDPHGDPIPDNNGRMKRIVQINLIELPLNKTAEIIKVTGQSKTLLSELANKNILLGTKLLIKKRSPFDNSIEVKIKNKIVTITEPLAKHLFVKLI